MTGRKQASVFFNSMALVAMLGVSGCASIPGPIDRTNVESWMGYFEIPGASIAVFNDFELDYVETHGAKSRTTGEPVTTRTLFQAASLSKSVSAVGVMSLVQDGVISLDADVNDYLTSWRVPDSEFQDTSKVTLRRLLSHTAGTTVHGFRGYRYTERVPTLVQILDGIFPANSAPVVVDLVPGTQFRYSGGGYLIVEQVVLDVAEVPFPEFIRERVLEPLGMGDSTFEQPLVPSWRDSAASGYYADGTPVPGGHHIYPEIAAAGLWTTPTDLARFLIELQLSLRGESNQVLNKKNTEILLTEMKNDYAQGFSLRSHKGQPYFWHAGANDGFRGIMIAHRSGGFGLIVLTNSDNGSEFAEAVLNLIGKRERWPGY
jgi:CubicO group peptidase (beta-lactamase class C family)